ncbi:hypothetical protein [Cohnella faecalis]|uniref:Penicillin-binding protein dimerisation domain-containing protein n=1 Tax=Cohnella faecalis TaxID=2315694 RepID=A0A398CLH3_9BACL|nr:hypothetical protein [Cohnella faecalis]RIE03082.1 hypothetical protein D3H35_21100 [Cohnella faecalis]
MSNRFAYRAFQMLLILVCLFAIAALRLAWVQLGSGRGRAEPSASIARQAVLEHSDELVIDTGRGRFLDRNGYLLTDRTVNGLVAFPTGGMQEARRLRSINWRCFGNDGRELIQLVG